MRTATPTAADRLLYGALPLPSHAPERRLRPAVSAEVYTEDQVFRFLVDITAALESLTNDEIFSLAEAEWGFDGSFQPLVERLDQIGHAQVAEMLSYCQAENTSYACSVNLSQVHSWLRRNRPHLFERIAEAGLLMP